MKSSVIEKLEKLQERYQEVQALLGDPEVANSQDRYRSLMKEFSQLEGVVSTFVELQEVQEELVSAQAMLAEDDADMRELAQEEIETGSARQEELEHQLQILLLPTDPNEVMPAFKIRAGTGGFRHLRAIYTGCTHAMQKVSVGSWKCSVRMKVNMVALKKSLYVLAVKVLTDV